MYHALSIRFVIYCVTFKQIKMIINRANVVENRSEHFGATGPRKMAFSIENVQRSYNRVALM